MIIGSVLLSVLSYVMYLKYSANSINEINKISEKMLDQSYNATESYWFSTLDYLSNLFYNSNTAISTNKESGNTTTPLFNALYTNVDNPFDRGEISQKLAEIAASNPLIQSVYVYNKRSDTVYSDTAAPLSVNDFFDKGIIDILKTNKFTHEIEYIPRKVRYSYASKDIQYNTISIIYTDTSGNKAPESALIFNLKQDSLQQIINTGSRDNASEIFIVNQDGIVISHPDTSLVNSSLRSENYIEKILGSRERTGSFTMTVNGQKMLFTYRKESSILQWIFVSKSDYEMLLLDVKKLRENILIISVIFILLSIIIASVFTREIYSPLTRILKKIPAGDTGKPDEKPLNEYALLSNTFDTLVKNVSELKYSDWTKTQVMKKDFLKQMIYGEAIEQNDKEKKIKELNVCLEGSCYTIAVFKIDCVKTVEKKYGSNDISLMRFAMLNIAEEIFERVFRVEGIDSEADNITLIINVNDVNDASKARLKETIKKVQESIRTYLEFTVTASIGSFVEHTDDIHFSFKNAKAALGYRHIFGKQSLIDYFMLKETIDKQYEYPFETEKHIISLLKGSDESQTNKAANEFIGYVSRYSYDEMLVSIVQLALAVIRSVKSMIDIENEENNMSYIDIYQQLGSLDEIEELKKWLEVFINSRVKLIKEVKSSKYDDITQRILEYIDGNYQDFNISVESIAEKVSLSPNYTRTIFKEKTGKSISNYISERRFGKAIELLKGTQYSANKIAEMVGFPNSAYFFVAFKKYMGKTPDEFRRESV